MKPWYVYLLVNENGRSYVGCTTDYTRRLRQHNGEIKGGARSTRGYTWTLMHHIPAGTSRREAMKLERFVKKAKGYKGRHMRMLTNEESGIRRND